MNWLIAYRSTCFNFGFPFSHNYDSTSASKVMSSSLAYLIAKKEAMEVAVPDMSHDRSGDPPLRSQLMAPQYRGREMGDWHNHVRAVRVFPRVLCLHRVPEHNKVGQKPTYQSLYVAHNLTTKTWC